MEGETVKDRPLTVYVILCICMCIFVLTVVICGWIIDRTEVVLSSPSCSMRGEQNHRKREIPCSLNWNVLGVELGSV